METVIACAFIALIAMTWIEPFYFYKNPIPFLQPRIFTRKHTFIRSANEMLMFPFDKSANLLFHCEKSGQILYYRRNFNWKNILTKRMGEMGEMHFSSRSGHTEATFIHRWTCSSTALLIIIFGLLSYLLLSNPLESQCLQVIVSCILLGAVAFNLYIEKSNFKDNVNEIIEVVEYESRKLMS